MIAHIESMPAIDDALRDRSLLGAALGDPETWTTWLAVLRAAFGLPLDAAQLETFSAVAGGRAPPTQRVREFWAICARRAGKSRMAAAIGVFLACFIKHTLAAGERGMVLILAASQEQARIVFAYAKAFLEASPVLRQEIIDVTRSEIRLRNGITIAIHSNSFRTIRGRTLCACVFDEVAIWRDELSAAPDTETYTAVLPSLLTTHGMLVGISTGYRRIGLLHAKYRDHFGIASDDTLVVQGSTLQFNQSLSESDIAAQRAADPAAVASEWDGGFRDDIASFLDDELIDAAVDHGRPLELPPQTGVYYQMFVDASGGVGADAYSIAVAHKEGTENARFVVDVVRGTSGKFDPQQVTKDYATLAKQYRIDSVVGDYYGAEWVAGAWQDCGITYMRSDLPKSQLYLEALPLFTRGLVRLPDHPRLVRELRLLERRTHRGGKDTVDHPRGGHDYYANVVSGVLRNLSNYLGYNLDYSGWVGDPVTDPNGAGGWHALRTSLYLQSGGLFRLW
jgi:hypothetical protein